MKTRIFVHNGDVQAIECELPAGVSPIEPTPLAYGEKSGHIHIATGDVKLYRKDETIYAVVGNDGASLEHVHEKMFNGDYSKKQASIADHKPSVLPANKTFKIGIHNKYNPFKKVFEKVLD